MKSYEATIAMLGIGTAVPDHVLDQAETTQRLSHALSNTPDAARWAKRIFKQCGVQTRYTCEPGLLEPAENNRYFAQKSGLPVPTTAERMATYKQAAPPLALQAAKKALADAGVGPEAITHLLTVSCTGQFLPGLDAVLVWQLGLSRSVNRIPLTFLGCAAGLKAIGIARDLVAAHPAAVTLIVSVELCTIHMQSSPEREALFGASFFGDGASACVIGSAEQSDGPVFALGKAHSGLMPDSAGEMIWEVGNYGYDLFLSPRISQLIGDTIPGHLTPLLRDGGPDPGIWAIHPGGKGIIDALEDTLGLSEEHTGFSRNVLRVYGNMSSATILFVLADIRESLKRDGAERTEGFCLAFGPGLSCEIVPIAYLPNKESKQQVGTGAGMIPHA
ncbi:type III polyketide synthase [Paenibacillus rhizovicinus]|uniref:Type III polyketide synthase n=1 Tax=Paenibacillus rhizovicinus TaxID=2704463 RepID=A0A6C0NUD7_9BACL|nr:type III polyketide synthase [Paenibacillus rhizovicinus]QHW29778.1 type III polyketide synthase [Paenibacillus rhizovicinus]